MSSSCSHASLQLFFLKKIKANDAPREKERKRPLIVTRGPLKRGKDQLLVTYGP
jgi:hypothetical protein